MNRLKAAGAVLVIVLSLAIAGCETDPADDPLTDPGATMPGTTQTPAP